MYLHEGNAVPRWHAPRGGGAEVVRRLVAAAEERGVEIRCDARVSALLTEDGAVTGVEVDGEALHADAVLVATGGFTGSPELVERHGPDAGPGSRVLLGGAPSATGDGLALLGSVGAAFVGLDRLWLYPYGTPDDLDPTGTRGMAARGVRNEIWVNADGRRFHDENLRGGATGTPALLAQRPATCWSIFDDDEARLLTLTHPGYGTDEEPDRAAVATFLERSPFAHRAATLADARTVRRAARRGARGDRPRLQRGLRPRPAARRRAGARPRGAAADRPAAVRRAPVLPDGAQVPRGRPDRPVLPRAGRHGRSDRRAVRRRRGRRHGGRTHQRASRAGGDDVRSESPLRTHRRPRHDRSRGGRAASHIGLSEGEAAHVIEVQVGNRREPAGDRSDGRGVRE